MSGQHAGSRTDLATEPVRRASSDSAILRADPATHYVVRPSPTALDQGPLSPTGSCADAALWSHGHSVAIELSAPAGAGRLRDRARVNW